jgi:hypothetical protein
MRILALRVVWLTLPLSAGTAAADALADWADGPKVVAAILLWLAWAVVALAVLAPRPAGLTALRTVAPTFAILAIAATAGGSTSGVAAAGVIVATLAAAVLATSPEISFAAANSRAYGDELRFPLRVPPTLFALLLPVTRAACVAGIAAGPLLIADGEVGWGVAALAVGVPLAAFSARALLVLALRWLVLVPAGVVVVDPMTLADPVLVTRRQLRSLRAASGTVPVPAGGLDLRLGATVGTVVVELDAPAPFVRSGRGRASAVTTPAAVALLAVVARSTLLEAAAHRRVPIEPAP